MNTVLVGFLILAIIIMWVLAWGWSRYSLHYQKNQNGYKFARLSALLAGAASWFVICFLIKYLSP